MVFMESGDLEAAHDAGESRIRFDRAVVTNLDVTTSLKKDTDRDNGGDRG